MIKQHCMAIPSGRTQLQFNTYMCLPLYSEQKDVTICVIIEKFMEEMYFDRLYSENRCMLRAITDGEIFNQNLQRLLHRFEAPVPRKFGNRFVLRITQQQRRR